MSMDDLKRIEQERIEAEELSSNSAARMPICICVDSSYSMCADGKIKAVNDGIRKMVREIRSSLYSRESVDLCLIAFGSEGAQIVRDFTNVDNFSFEDLKPDGCSPLADAVSFAVERIEKRVSLYKRSATQYYSPLLVILGGGNADDEDECVKIGVRLKRMQRDREINVICACFGYNNESLNNFVSNNRIVDINRIDISDFMSHLSKSVEQVNKSSYIYDEDEVFFDLSTY